MSSSIKANAIGIEVNRKVKRLGCSAIKDLLENKKLDIIDENTIMETSTFVAKGQSYEASDGNHDDLMMNLVLFGYFTSTQYFGDMTNINLKQMIFNEQMKQIEDDMVPFGYVDDGAEHIENIERSNSKYDWAIEYDHNF